LLRISSHGEKEELVKHKINKKFQQPAPKIRSDQDYNKPVHKKPLVGSFRQTKTSQQALTEDSETEEDLGDDLLGDDLFDTDSVKSKSAKGLLKPIKQKKIRRLT
jgi:hypothetical protein